MSDYWMGVLSVFAVAALGLVAIVGARVLTWSATKFGHVVYSHGQPRRTNQQRRASMAAVHYGAHHGRVFVVGNAAISFLSGMDHDDRIWATERLTKRVELADIGLSDDFKRRMTNPDAITNEGLTESGEAK